MYLKPFLSNINGLAISKCVSIPYQSDGLHTIASNSKVFISRVNGASKPNSQKILHGLNSLCTWPGSLGGGGE